MHLTPRDRELLQLVGQGLTNREIGERTRLKEQTIKNYLSALCLKLGVKNRVQLAIAASRLLGEVGE